MKLLFFVLIVSGCLLWLLAGVNALAPGCNWWFVALLIFSGLADFSSALLVYPATRGLHD